MTPLELELLLHIDLCKVLDGKLTLYYASCNLENHNDIERGEQYQGALLRISMFKTDTFIYQASNKDNGGLTFPFLEHTSPYSILCFQDSQNEIVET